MTLRVWTEDQIVELLQTSKMACARAVIALYDRQTESEKELGETNVENGRGFSAYDAEFMSSIAVALPKWNMNLTSRQLAVCRKVLPKYRRQLAEIANEKEAARAMETSAHPMPPAQPATQAQSSWGRF